MQIRIIDEHTNEEFIVWGTASFKDGILLVSGEPGRSDDWRSFCETYSSVTLQSISHSMFELRGFQIAPSGTGELPKQFKIQVRFT